MLLFQYGFAQFTVTEDFRGSGSPDIIVGDNAHLTSGIEDPVGAGWLRLTSDDNDQQGYAYINRSFPSTQGVLVDFEYTMWRTHEYTYNGADGLSVFLFDASYGPGTFALGAYGGSLGYANSTAVSPQNLGLTGGYIGIGLDAYGNFTAASEGKNDGSNGVSPNSVTLRGATTGSMSTTNPYLEGVTITYIGSGLITFDSDAKNKSGNPKFNGIDYNTITSTRPNIVDFYRRVQIKILPVSGGNYEITVRMAPEYGGSFTDLMTYTTSTPPPSLLKLGFAASTGGGVNNHEIRNLIITTLGNLRVHKSADVDILRSKSSTTGPSNEITYNIDVTNDTSADLVNIAFEDQLTDGNGNPIPDEMFEITSVTAQGFLPGTTLPDPSETNPITNGEMLGLLKLAANSVGNIQIKGKLKDIPKRNLLINTVNVNDDDITDTDLSNNTSSVSTPVVSEKSDLVVDSSVDETCLNTGSGNTFTVKVRNIGLLDLTYGNQPGNQIKVTTTLPSGVTASNTSNSGWTFNQNGNVLTFTKTVSGGGNATNTLSLNESLPEITYTLSSSSSNGYTHEISVASESEDPDNTDNNSTSNLVAPPPNPPTIADTEIEYSQYAEAPPLSATPEEGNTLLWALNDGGVTTTVPYTPNTEEAGTTEYWVAQKTPGGCISDFSKITVKVNPGSKINPGAIGSSQEVCPEAAPDAFTSEDDGSTGAELSYIWQKSTNNGQTWTIISGATGATFQPVAVNEITSFRRVTVDASGSYFPTDPVTVFLATDGNCAIKLCTANVQGENFSWNFGNGTPSPVTQTMVQPATNAGFVFDIYELDNSFNMEINGTKLAVYEIEFQSDGTPAPGINIQFQDGNQYETDTEGDIWEMSGEPGKPLIRVVISPSGQIEMFGSKVSYTDPNYQLYPLEFIPSKGNSFNTIHWNTTSNNVIIVSQNVVGATAMEGYGSGKSLVPCSPYGLKKDGVFNDEDGNGSAQPNETITYTFALTNKGDIDIYQPRISDPLLGGEINIVPDEGDDNNDGVLNIGETWIYTMDYPVSQTEIDAGGVYNRALVDGQTVEGYILDPEKSTDPTPIDADNPLYDSDRPDHTFVYLPPEWIITNPTLPSKAKK